MSVKRGGLGLIAAISWRNLWRNRLRTGLSAGGIAFAVMLILAARSAQISSMTAMLDNTTRMLTGHVQIQNVAYADDPALRNLIADATAVARALAQVPDVTVVAQRALTFVLVSVGDRSYGAQVMGVDPEAERAISSLPDMLIEGHYLEQPTDAVVGSLMAHNLGAKLGDEVVILGSMLDGGVAAMSLRIAGIVDTGTEDLDRALIQVQLTARSCAHGDRAGERLHAGRIGRAGHRVGGGAVRTEPGRALMATPVAGTHADGGTQGRVERGDVRPDRTAGDVQRVQQLHDDGV
ncbi:MAG: hypothetical protein NT024_05030 [Proteobacteria bacterium]|nr:hypothetical protein [Pseudomonadota bacterium]